MTFPELFKLPTSVPLSLAAKALGVHVNTAYKLIREGTFPCPVMRVGGRYRVATRALLIALHIDEIPIHLEDVNNGADFAGGRTNTK